MPKIILTLKASARTYLASPGDTRIYFPEGEQQADLLKHINNNSVAVPEGSIARVKIMAEAHGWELKTEVV